MADDGVTLREINWREAFGFTNLFRGFRIAVHPSKLVLALIALACLWCGGLVLDVVWPRSYQVTPQERSALHATETGRALDSDIDARVRSYLRDLGARGENTEAPARERYGVFDTFFDYEVGRANSVLLAPTALMRAAFLCCGCAHVFASLEPVPPLCTACRSLTPEAIAAELRAAIKALPDGEASAEGFMDNDGVELDRPVRFACTVRVKSGAITFDFTNSDRQAKGPINLRPSMIEACVFYSLIGALDPKLAFNDGMRDVVTFVYAPNTVTNASAPAPVSSYQAANQKLTDVILEALAPFRPERALANSGSSGAMLISWKDGGRPGQPSLQYEILGSAYGGGNGNDGASAVATHTSNLHITPIEILETEFPCRIVEFDMVQDSCGAGEFRGGLAFRCSRCALAGEREPADGAGAVCPVGGPARARGRAASDAARPGARPPSAAGAGVGAAHLHASRRGSDQGRRSG